MVIRHSAVPSKRDAPLRVRTEQRLVVMLAGRAVRLQGVPDLIVESHVEDGRARRLLIDLKTGMPRGQRKISTNSGSALMPMISRSSARTTPAISSSSSWAAASRPAVTATAEEAAASWSQTLRSGWAAVSSRVWDEVRGLIRVTPVDQPEAMLIAPDQAFFLRENLKLRLLNARLALLSRQFDTAQSDLRDALSALDRYFDRSNKRVVATAELLRQVSAQARQVVVPRPDATLAAIAAVSAGR